MVIAAHVMITGKVQGVFFRAYTQDEARMLGLKGWVRNVPDGRVEALFIGPQEAVKKMISWCHKGSPNAQVTNVQVTWLDNWEDTNEFTIRY